jgi:hypothetical protein
MWKIRGCQPLNLNSCGMKTNSTQILVLRILLFILICLYSILVFGQGSHKDQRAIYFSKDQAASFSCSERVPGIGAQESRY